MLSIEEAYQKSRIKAAECYKLLECTDTGDLWVFTYGVTDDHGKLEPGAPMIGVNKETGELKGMAIPPISNLHILQKGKKVEFNPEI